MIRILFVCHGNICRSPMAEYIFKEMMREKHVERLFSADSAGTSAEELGRPVYSPAKRELERHGVPCPLRRARVLTAADYQRYDYIIAMEQYNVRNMLRIFGGDPNNKISRLLDFTPRPGDIDDPWYSGDFDTVYKQIREGCAAMLDRFTAAGKIR